ncbi:mannonate dehydratase, partial [Dehalococcoides mccartyi]|nr:mannonate dehydratase [Dehalococcoides mccartyi]
MRLNYENDVGHLLLAGRIYRRRKVDRALCAPEKSLEREFTGNVADSNLVADYTLVPKYELQSGIIDEVNIAIRRNTSMRAGFGQIQQPLPEHLLYAQQFGATDIVLNTPAIPGVGGKWALADLVNMRRHVETFGMKLSAVENVPADFYYDIILNGPKRDEQIDNMITTVRNVARAGIPVFGYNWMASRVWRTSTKLLRGGATSTYFDYKIAKELPLTYGREYTEEEMWANLEYWIKIITPVAEEEGIRLGIHACDPPVDKLGGIPQLFNSFDNYRRYLDIYPSDSCAIEFCQGTISEMADSEGDGLYDFIAEMVQKNKVLYVHFRNVSAPNPEDFHEEFINT